MLPYFYSFSWSFGCSVVFCDEFHATSPLSLQTICFFFPPTNYYGFVLFPHTHCTTREQQKHKLDIYQQKYYVLCLLYTTRDRLQDTIIFFCMLKR